jgi:hypothetical protein
MYILLPLPPPSSSLLQSSAVEADTGDTGGNKLPDAGVEGVGGVKGGGVAANGAVAVTTVTGMGDVSGTLAGRGEKGEPVATVVAVPDVGKPDSREGGGGGESKGREIEGERQSIQGKKEGIDVLDGKGKEVTARRVSMEMTI